MESSPAPLPSRLRDVWTAELPHASGVVRVLLRGLTTCFGEPLDFQEERRRAPGLPAGPRRALARQVVDQVMSEIARLSQKRSTALAADRRAS